MSHPSLVSAIPLVLLLQENLIWNPNDCTYTFRLPDSTHGILEYTSQDFQFFSANNSNILERKLSTNWKGTWNTNSYFWFPDVLKGDYTHGVISHFDKTSLSVFIIQQTDFPSSWIRCSENETNSWFPSQRLCKFNVVSAQRRQNDRRWSSHVTFHKILWDKLTRSTSTRFLGIYHNFSAEVLMLTCFCIIGCIKKVLAARDSKKNTCSNSERIVVGACATCSA